MALIDVAIPNYNYGRYLPQCIESIHRQGLGDIRILIVDNASTDHSVAIAAELAAADPRITLVTREQNLGHHASYNYAVDWAASPYFMLLCADDLLVEGCFRRSLEVMEANEEVAFAAGSELVWWEDQTSLPPIPRRNPEWRVESTEAFAVERSLPAGEELFGGGFALVRTADLKRVGHFRSDIAFNEDLELYLRLSLKRQIARTSAVHGVRRVHGSNMSAILWQDVRSDIVDTSNAFEFFFSGDGADLPEARGLRQQVRRNLGKRAYWSAMSHVVRGRAGDGAALFATAICLSPRLALLPPLDYLFRLRDPVGHIRSRFARSTGPAGSLS